VFFSTRLKTLVSDVSGIMKNREIYNKRSNHTTI
jgi:hypothetical protein